MDISIKQKKKSAYCPPQISVMELPGLIQEDSSINLSKLTAAIKAQKLKIRKAG